MGKATFAIVKEHQSVLVIAEAGVNHNGNLDTGIELIDAAAAAGVDYVKFQTFRADRLVSRTARMAEYQVTNTGDAGGAQYDMLRALELDDAAHRTLIDHCVKRGIKFFSTAFDLESLDYLEGLGLDRFKVPSGEITNLPYLRRVASYGKPVLVSTGMCNLTDVEAALEVLLSTLDRDQITLLHCNTEYPTPMEDVNLRAMNTLATAFRVPVGYSDHTLGIEVPIAAVARGAVCIEKHFTLSRDLPGPDHRASLEPEELRQMVAAIRNIEKALGDGIKRPSPSELPNREVARKSIHTARELAAGAEVKEDDLIMLRPGDGVSPMEMDRVLGRLLRHDLPAYHALKLEDLA